MMAVVGIAGPITNLFLAWAAGIVLRVGNPSGTLADLIEVFAVVNVLLAVFNMLPVPPLDGSRLLPLVLNESGRKVYARVEQYGILIIFAVVILSRGALGAIIGPPVRFLLRWVVGL